MKKISAILAGAVLVTGLAAAPALQARERLTGEAKLAKMLDGREAGKPVNCIPVYNTNHSEIIDKTAIVYKVGSTYYVNRPTNADQLDSDDIMVTELHNSQLCSLDVVNLHDRSSPSFWHGFVGLRQFVPYKKVSVASAD